jgi:tetratricopeptide (TPR) repeat protein
MWSSDSLKHTIRITGNLSQLYERLHAGAESSAEEMAWAAQELDELANLAAVPGAAQMHQKYDSLLHPYLQQYGLRTGAPPLAWDQDAAMRQAFDQFEQSISRSNVVDFVHSLYRVVQELHDGITVSDDTLNHILARLDGMQTGVQQLAVEYPQLPGQFQRGVQRLRDQLGDLAEQKVSAGNDHALRGQVEQALPLYQAAHDYYAAAEDAEGQGLALLGQAQAYHRQERHAEAEAAYRQSQGRFRQAGARRSECVVVYAWGNLCLERSQHEQARSLYEQGIRLAEADPARQAEGHRRVGDAWAAEGRFERTIVSYQSSLDVARQSGNHDEQRQTWTRLGSLHAALHNSAEAIRNYEAALTLTDEATYPEEKAAILVQLNLAFQDTGQMERAREAWGNAIELARNMDDPMFEEFVRMSQPP